MVVLIANPPSFSDYSTSEPIVIGSSSKGKGKKRRSKAWEFFDVIEEGDEKPIKARCKYCLTEIKCGTGNGTAGMLNHNKICKKKPGLDDQPPNLSSTNDATANAMPNVIGDSSSRKRRRVDEESAQVIAANTSTPWDKAELSNRIQKIISRLQDIRGEVSEVFKLHESDSASNLDHNRSATSDQHLRTSSLVSRQLYGRVAEKKSILKLMMLDDTSTSIIVLPIVGIAGVGKTALTQHVYNEPNVASRFQHRVWIWVSRNFDEVRVTREMLNFVSRERHEEINCFVKLQEILKIHVKSKRVLIILDDVWDDMNDCRWNQLLAPFKFNSAHGNVILVTTRKLSVAKMVGTTEPIKLGVLEEDDFWLLFKSCALGDRASENPGNLCTIGQQIAEKLKGNPLAAVTAGALLRDHLTVDHWSNILKKEEWKSLCLSGGIMPALKLSYDELPYHLQRCLSYCSIFPDKYKFLGKDLVYIWISQGFVSCTNVSKSLEEIGWQYVIDMTNMGFFQQVRGEESSSFFNSNCQTWYVMCGLMHDFARMISRSECATIDGLRCNEMMSTVRHLSVITDSAYEKDRHGNILRNEKFEEYLRITVTSVRKLRTLVLLGHYDSFFSQLFKDIFKKAHNLHLLQMSATSDDFSSFLCGLASSVHLRYLKLESDGSEGDFPQVLVNCFHLQVLDVGSNTDPILPNGMHNLVNLRYLVADREVCSSIASIGSMTSLQHLHNFKVQFCCIGFEITQLQSMNELVQLGVSELQNVKTRYDANGAKLRDKRHLEELRLLWTHTPSRDEYATETSFQHPVDNVERDVELLSTVERGPSSEPCLDRAREVLEGLEPHQDLKHLQISGYYGATSPTWLANNISVTSLRTLHLDSCGEWEILPFMERFPLLIKLKLTNLRKVIEVLVPSLEELVLVEMPKLQRCLCISVGGLSSSLRALHIDKCQALKTFDLFMNDHKIKLEQRSWLSGLRKLIMRDCPQLKVLNPLPPSATFSELLISGVSTLPSMKGSSSETLHIGSFNWFIDHSSDELTILDGKILAFHNLRRIKLMRIYGCRNLMSISFEGFSHLVFLERLEIHWCEKLFSSHVFPEHILEDAPVANCKAFPSLEILTIEFCGIAGKWLSLMLRHAPDLRELILESCPHITTLLSTEEEESSPSNLIMDRGYSSSGNLDDALAELAQDEILHIPSNPVSSLRKITIQGCPCLTFNGSKNGFSRFTSLEGMTIYNCPELFSPLGHRAGNDDHTNGRWLFPTSLGELDIDSYSQETLQLCFPSPLTSLKKLEVLSSPGLESLQLQSCTALEELIIGGCGSLTALEGLQSLGNLRHLKVSDCPGLPPYLESLSRQGYEVCSRLEGLHIDDPSVLTKSFCKHLTSLQRLELGHLSMEATTLTDEQERALLLLKSLQELDICGCYHLVDLPARLVTLTSLNRFKIHSCSVISRLPLAF